MLKLTVTFDPKTYEAHTWVVVRDREGREMRIGARSGHSRRTQVELLFDDPEHHFDIIREKLADGWRGHT